MSNLREISASVNVMTKDENLKEKISNSIDNYIQCLATEIYLISISV